MIHETYCISFKIHFSESYCNCLKKITSLKLLMDKIIMTEIFVIFFLT